MKITLLRIVNGTWKCEYQKEINIFSENGEQKALK